jgi:hypothetical protein
MRVNEISGPKIGNLQPQLVVAADGTLYISYFKLVNGRAVVMLAESNKPFKAFRARR